MRKKVLIIGAGVAGLTAGCYGLMSGLDVEIIEKNSQAGGLCTTWKHNEYSFGGCISFLQGISPKFMDYQIFQELSIIQDLDFIYQDKYNSVLKMDGSFFHAYADPNKLKEELLTISPEDREIITTFTDDISLLSKINQPIFFTWKSLHSYLTLKKVMKKYKVAPWKFALKFKNSQLAGIFEKAFSINDQSLFFSMYLLASLYTKNSGYPIGGSLRFINSLENKFRKLGGKIRFSETVNHILVKKNKAAGVTLTSGEQITSDCVISCADGHTTLFEWLDNKYLTYHVKEIYKKMEVFPPILYLSLAINGDYSYLPHRFTLSYPKGINIEPTKIDFLTIENHSFDRTIIPIGKSIFHIILPTVWNIWKHWDADKNEYQSKKTKIIQNITFALGEKFPDIPKQIIYSDLATPITFYRFSGNWQGSCQGFLINEKKQIFPIPQKLPFLKRFYMAGHWTTAGGNIYFVSISARNAIAKLCHELRIPFKADSSIYP